MTSVPSLDLLSVIVPAFLPPAVSSTELADSKDIVFLDGHYHKYEVDTNADSDMPFAKVLQDLFLFWAETVVNQTDLPLILSQLMCLHTLEDVPCFDKEDLFYKESVKQLMLNVGFAMCPAPAAKLFAYLGDIGSNFECKGFVVEELFEGPPTLLQLKQRHKDALLKKWRETPGLGTLDSFYGWETPVSAGELVQSFNERMSKELAKDEAAAPPGQAVNPFSNIFDTHSHTSKILKQRFAHSTFWTKLPTIVADVCRLGSGWMCIKALLRLVLLGLSCCREIDDSDRVEGIFQVARGIAATIEARAWPEATGDLVQYLDVLSCWEQRILREGSCMKLQTLTSHTKSTASQEKNVRYQELYKVKHQKVMQKMADRQKHYREMMGLQKDSGPDSETKGEPRSGPASASKQTDTAVGGDACVITQEPIASDDKHYLMVDVDVVSLKRMAELSFLQSLASDGITRDSSDSERAKLHDLRVIAAATVAKLRSGNELGLIMKTCSHTTLKLENIQSQEPVDRELKEYKFCPLCRAGFNLLVRVPSKQGFKDNQNGIETQSSTEYELLNQAWQYLSSRREIYPKWLRQTPTPTSPTQEETWQFFSQEFKKLLAPHLSLAKKANFNKDQVINATSYAELRRGSSIDKHLVEPVTTQDSLVALAELGLDKANTDFHLARDITRLEQEVLQCQYDPFEYFGARAVTPEGLLQMIYTGLFETSQLWGFGKTAKSLAKAYWALTCVDRDRESSPTQQSVGDLFCLGKIILYTSRPLCPRTLELLRQDGLLEEDIVRIFSMMLVGSGSDRQMCSPRQACLLLNNSSKN